MGSQEDDVVYKNLKRDNPKRSKHTKFRDFDDTDSKRAKRNKPNSKRSHRPKTIKNDYWPDADD